MKIITKVSTAVCIDYTGDGWYEYVEPVFNDSGFLVGIYNYRRNNGWTIDEKVYSLYEYADEGDIIMSPVELAIAWLGYIH